MLVYLICGCSTVNSPQYFIQAAGRVRITCIYESHRSLCAHKLATSYIVKRVCFAITIHTSWSKTCPVEWVELNGAPRRTSSSNSQGLVSRGPTRIYDLPACHRLQKHETSISNNFSESTRLTKAQIEDDGLPAPQVSHTTIPRSFIAFLRDVANFRSCRPLDRSSCQSHSITPKKGSDIWNDVSNEGSHDDCWEGSPCEDILSEESTTRWTVLSEPLPPFCVYRVRMIYLPLYLCLMILSCVQVFWKFKIRFCVLCSLRMMILLGYWTFVACEINLLLQTNMKHHVVFT